MYGAILVVNFKDVAIEVNDTLNDFDFAELLVAAFEISLIVKLKLQTVSTIKLDPFAHRCLLVLPRPIKSLNCFG